jgi:hypothetical protein
MPEWQVLNSASRAEHDLARHCLTGQILAFAAEEILGAPQIIAEIFGC